MSDMTSQELLDIIKNDMWEQLHADPEWERMHNEFYRKAVMIGELDDSLRKELIKRTEIVLGISDE